MTDPTDPGGGARPPRVELRPMHAPRLFPVLVGVYVVVAGAFLAWRLTTVAWDVWFAPLLFAADVFAVFTTVLFLVITRRIDVPVPRRPERPYVVDILIPTINEPPDVLRATIAAATQVEGHRAVLVLDDGDRAEVARLCAELGAEYHARRDNRHAKAGNLNHGLRFTDAELVATLDADHIARPDFLTRLVGYFDDPAVGFVQTPQTYYNHDSFLFRRRRDQSLWSEQGMFYDVIQPAKNRANAAFYVGTSAILRRSALDEVGGFATGTATEDIHTSLRLHARGWRSLFVPEVLALGLEASSLREFYRQRRRWAAGSLGLLLRSADSPLVAPGLTLGQRMNYLSATLAHGQGVQRAFYLLIPAVCVATRTSPVTVDPLLLLAAYIPFLAVSLGLTWLFSRGTYHPWHTEAYGLASIPTHLSALKGVLHIQRKFEVSRKRVTRGEPTWVRRALWGFVLVAVLTLVVALGLLAASPGDDDLVPLVIACALATVVNGGLLASFLVYLRRYERVDHTHAQVAPGEVLATHTAPVPLAATGWPTLTVPALEAAE